MSTQNTSPQHTATPNEAQRIRVVYSERYGAYGVSIPNWDGGEVVLATAFDAVVAEMQAGQAAFDAVSAERDRLAARVEALEGALRNLANACGGTVIEEWDEYEHARAVLSQERK